MLGSSRNEGELLEVMQRYCAAWLPSDLSRIPPECPDCRPNVVDDIPVLALAFKRAELMFTGPADAASLLHEMAAVFACAAEHLRAFRDHRPIAPWKAYRSHPPRL